MRADGGAEKALAPADGVNRLDQIGFGGILQQVGARAGLQRTDDVALVAVHAEDRDRDVGVVIATI